MKTTYYNRFQKPSPPVVEVEVTIEEPVEDGGPWEVCARFKKLPTGYESGTMKLCAKTEAEARLRGLEALVDLLAEEVASE